MGSATVQKTERIVDKVLSDVRRGVVRRFEWSMLSHDRAYLG